MKKIFLLGSERSGSNLLRTLIGNHSQISAPVAPHLCSLFFNRIHYYIPFTIVNLSALYSDLEIYLNHPFNEWNIKLNTEKLIRKNKLHDFIDVLNSVYAEKAELEKKTAYFSKDNDLHLYALGIKLKFNDAYFVYLYRDPRDQVASWKRSSLSHHTTYSAINKWTKEQQACLKLIDFFGLKIHKVKYEELVDNPEKIITALLNYIDLPVEEKCFQTNIANKEAGKHTLWRNINQPVKNKNYNKFRDVLNENEIRMIETISMEVMNQLNYLRVTTGIWKMKNKYLFKFSEKSRIVLKNKKNKNLINEEMKLLLDKHKTLKEIFLKRARKKELEK